MPVLIIRRCQWSLNDSARSSPGLPILNRCSRHRSSSPLSLPLPLVRPVGHRAFPDRPTDGTVEGVVWLDLVLGDWADHFIALIQATFNPAAWSTFLKGLIASGSLRETIVVSFYPRGNQTGRRTCARARKREKVAWRGMHVSRYRKKAIWINGFNRGRKFQKRFSLEWSDLMFRLCIALACK